jgi:hypothetical protein
MGESLGNGPQSGQRNFVCRLINTVAFEKIGLVLNGSLCCSGGNLLMSQFGASTHTHTNSQTLLLFLQFPSCNCIHSKRSRGNDVPVCCTITPPFSDTLPCRVQKTLADPPTRQKSLPTEEKREIVGDDFHQMKNIERSQVISTSSYRRRK